MRSEEHKPFTQLFCTSSLGGGDEALSDAICSNNSINTGSRAGPSPALAGSSEVTQGRGREGGRGETGG